MTNFRNQNDPKIIPNLSSDHAFKSENNQNVQSQKPVNFKKMDSSSFKETKVLYQSGTPIPEFSKTKKEPINMPKIQYTEEKVLPRPIADNQAPLKIEIDEKEDMPKFTKSVIEPLKEVNPTLEMFQNAKTSEETIKMEEEVIPVKTKKEKKKSGFMKWILIGILIEIIVLGIIYVVKNVGSKEILECTGEEYSSYYEANIINTKKYTFVKGKITKLEDTVKYVFDNKEAYEEFKSNYANPPKKAIDGRIFISNINDNNNTYEEKTNYDYKKLRKKNTSSDEHNITVTTTNDDDTISLLDYNITDIKIIYESDYICR